MSSIGIIYRKIKNRIYFAKLHINVYGWKTLNRLWAVLRGFAPATIEICGVNTQNRNEYLSDEEYKERHPYNGAYSGIIDNKLYLPLLFHKYKENIPRYWYFVDECGLLPLEDSLKEEGVRVPYDRALDLLKREGIIVLKHTHSSLGEGFLLIEFKSGIYYINHEEVDKDNILKKIKGLREYIITEFVQQHSYAANICSTSLNTVRMLFVWNHEQESFNLVRSFHRFGCNGNIVDNIGSGNGVLVFVDPETGRLLGEGAINSHQSGDRYVQEVQHPDNGFILKDLQIPRFSEIKNKVLQIVNEHSYLRYVGIDIAVTENSFKIIEVNSLSSLDVTQQRSGFLKDPIIRTVLKRN